MSAQAKTRGELRAIFGMFRMRLIGDMQYRAAAWAGVATQFCWGFMLLAVYWAFYQSSTADPGMTFEQLACYVWLQQGLLALVMLWFQDNELLTSIQQGTVAYELCRPVGLYGLWFARLLGMRLSRVALRIWPIALIATLLPYPFKLILPPSWQAAGMFTVSLIVSALLVVAVSMFIYILTFVTLSSRGSRMLFGLAADFLAGTMIPIPLMPQGLQRMLDWLPFRYTFDLPARIYSGHIAGLEALRGVGIQLFWLALLMALGIWALNRSLRRLVVQGG